MFKGSRGVRLQYKKSDGSYDYVQSVILPNGEKILVHGNSNEGSPIDSNVKVDLKLASDLRYAYSMLVGLEGYQPMHVVPNWDILVGYSQLFDD